MSGVTYKHTQDKQAFVNELKKKKHKTGKLQINFHENNTGVILRHTTSFNIAWVKKRITIMKKISHFAPPGIFKIEGPKECMTLSPYLCRLLN